MIGKTLFLSVVLEGSPIGLVTSAVKIGNRIYTGTAMGDRIAYRDLSR